MSIAFSTIRERAEARKGGAAAVARVLADRPDAAILRALPDDRILAEMTRHVFYAGFARQVIDAKWQDFEQAFSGFDPAYLNIAPDDYWHGLASDPRIVRNGAKIMSVRANASFVRALADEHGSAGRFLADWPADDQIGLLDLLGRRGSRLGGLTGQYVLRAVGRDGFILSKHVLACLRGIGLPLSETGTTRKDLRIVQDAFNGWAAETHLPLTQLSKISALSVESDSAH